MRVHEKKRKSPRDNARTEKAESARDKQQRGKERLTNLAGLQQLSELVLVHPDYSLGSSATKRNAKDGGREKSEDEVGGKKILFTSPRGEEKKLRSQTPSRQGLFLPRLAEGSVPSFQFARQQKLEKLEICAEL